MNADRTQSLTDMKRHTDTRHAHTNTNTIKQQAMHLTPHDKKQDILTVTFCFCSITLKPHWSTITLHIQETIHLTPKRFWLAVIMLYHWAFLANYLMLLKIRWQQEQMKYAVTFIIIHSCPWSFSDIIKDKYCMIIAFFSSSPWITPSYFWGLRHLIIDLVYTKESNP